MKFIEVLMEVEKIWRVIIGVNCACIDDTSAFQFTTDKV